MAEATNTTVDRNTNGQFAPSRNLTSEATGQQNGRGGDKNFELWRTQYSNYGMLCANGGDPTNPMGFPGYNELYAGTPAVYRWMLQHPILRLVRSICTTIVLASSWEYQKTAEDVPDAWMAAVEENFDAIRGDLVADFFVRGRDFGWAAGEPIWEYRDGFYYLSEVKPLLPEITELMVDEDTGKFVGLKNRGKKKDLMKSEVALAAPMKAWVYTYDSESGYLYGRSWLENVRTTAWKDWLDCAQQLQKLGAKISGIVTIITSPSGTFPGPVGDDGKPTQVSYAKNAIESIKALANGASGIWFPSLGLLPDAKGNIDAMKVLVELAGKSLTNIDVKDFSGNAKAIAPILERMKHDEELMFAGGLRSARVGLEAQHGTKAEAGIHTDTGTINAEAEDEHFARKCQPLVDAFLTVNFGERARGKVRIKPMSLIDRKTATLKAILLSLMNVPEIAREIAIAIDTDKLFNALDIEYKKPFDGEAAKAAAEKAQATTGTKTPEPQGGRPTE